MESPSVVVLQWYPDYQGFRQGEINLILGHIFVIASVELKIIRDFQSAQKKNISSLVQFGSVRKTQLKTGCGNVNVLQNDRHSW